MTALAIKTADGWQTIGDFQSIKPKQVAGEKIIRDDLFCGWSPSPMGVGSNKNAQDFSEKMHLAGPMVESGVAPADAWKAADAILVDRRVLESAQRVTRSAVAAR